MLYKTFDGPLYSHGVIRENHTVKFKRCAHKEESFIRLLVLSPCLVLSSCLALGSLGSPALQLWRLALP